MRAVRNQLVRMVGIREFRVWAGAKAALKQPLTRSGYFRDWDGGEISG